MDFSSIFIHSILDLFGIGLTTIGLTDSGSRTIGLTILSNRDDTFELTVWADNNRADRDGISNLRADVISVSPLKGEVTPHSWFCAKMRFALQSL